MDEQERSRALTLATDTAIRVGREVLLPRLRLGRAPQGLSKKGVRDLVTDADKAAEAAIVEAIRGAFPSHKIVAEEAVHDEVTSDDIRWYVDPLDGTTNFVHGLPLFTVSIACYGPDGGEAACVYAPYLGECFYAARGRGAHLRASQGPFAGEDRKLEVTSEGALIDAVLVTGFHYDMDRHPNHHLWSALLPRTRGLRRLGSAALDLAYVAAGRFDGMWETGLNPFDIAAGALLIEEAGGRVTDYGLGGTWLLGRELLATNGTLHAPLHEAIHAVAPAGGPLP